MTMHDKPRIARRSYLRGAGVTLATLGGMTGSVVAKGKGRGGPTPLTDRAADILVYWSQVDEDSNDPDKPSDFGFPDSSTPNASSGLTFAGHDPAGGGLFDFSRIKMMPNGDLKNRWLLLGGAVMATPPKPYKLNHLNGGMYQSRGQEMTFKARSEEEIFAVLKSVNPDLEALPPALMTLAGSKWHAVGLESAQLALDDDGDPDPTSPEWGATRVDFYERKSGDYGLSLLYVLGADDTGSRNPRDGIPLEAFGAGAQLITGGRLNPGGQ